MGRRVEPQSNHVAVVLFALALAQVACIGAAVERSLRVASLSTTERVSMALLLGCAGVAALSFAARLVPGGSVATSAVVAVAAMASLVVLDRQGVRLSPAVLSLRSRALGVWLAVLAPIVLLVCLRPLGWDALFVWALKARAIHESNGQLPFWYFSDITRGWSHPDYPLQVPLLQAFVYDWLGAEHQVAGKAVTGLYVVAGLPLIYAATARVTGRRVFGVAAVGLVLSTPQLLLQEGGLLSGYIDFPLAIVYCAAAIALAAYIDSGEWRAAALLSLLLCSAASLKNEGTVLALGLAAVALVVMVRRRHAGAAIVVAIPLALTLLSWRLFLAWQHALVGQDFVRRSLPELLQRRDWVVIGRELVKELTSIGHWGLLWPVVGSGLLIGLVRPATRRTSTVVLLATAGPVALFQAAYLFSLWGDVAAHIQSSLPRLLLQVAPLAIVGAAHGAGASEDLPQSNCAKAPAAMALE